MQGGQGASPLAVGGCDLAREKIVSCRIPALGFKQEIAGYGCRYGASSSAMGHNDRTGIAWPTDGRESDEEGMIAPVPGQILIAENTGRPLRCLSLIHI